MYLAALQEEVEAFVRAQGWYDARSARPQTPRNIAICLALEAAEVLEHFQWAEEPRDREALEGELADVCHYLLQLCSLLGVNLEEAVLRKLAANRARSW